MPEFLIINHQLSTINCHLKLIKQKNMPFKQHIF